MSLADPAAEKVIEERDLYRSQVLSLTEELNRLKLAQSLPSRDRLAFYETWEGYPAGTNFGWGPLPTNPQTWELGGTPGSEATIVSDFHYLTRHALRLRPSTRRPSPPGNHAVVAHTLPYPRPASKAVISFYYMTRYTVPIGSLVFVYAWADMNRYFAAVVSWKQPKQRWAYQMRRGERELPGDFAPMPSTHTFHLLRMVVDLDKQEYESIALDGMLFPFDRVPAID